MGNTKCCFRKEEDIFEELFKNKERIESTFTAERQSDIFEKRLFPDKFFGINLVAFLETKYKNEISAEDEKK